MADPLQLKLLRADAYDLSVVNSARVSFNKVHATMRDGDEQLIHFLMRNRHGTPFEHNFFCFHVVCPIFLQRDWMRHRVGHSFNEMSTRYTEMPFRIYEPELLRTQLGKPGDYHFEDFDPLVASVDEKVKHWYRRRYLIKTQERAFRGYQKMLKRGYAKEQAMAALPMGTYTEFYWSCNARSLMHFISLRSGPHPRKEIRVLTLQAEVALADHMPVTYEAFCENGRVAP